MLFSAVTAIDTSGLETLGELRKMLEKRSLQVQTLIDIDLRLEKTTIFRFLTSYNFLLQFVLVNPVGNVMEKLHMSKVLDTFGFKGVYLTVGEALADISTSEKAEP